MEHGVVTIDKAGAATRRPQVKILIVVWGRDYIKRLANYGLRSFLADGNLPALKHTCDVEVIFLTQRKNFNLINRLPVVRAIAEYAAVRCVMIDDLIGRGSYSVPLTLAFLRGMRIHGEAMTGIHFIFWNADFVMSDGTLAHLGMLIQSGRDVVVAASLRAIAEAVQPLIEDPDNENAPLSCSGRELVSYCLEHPHMMTVAKTVNQTFWRSSTLNQLFWKVDDNTLVGRYYQIFMFCIRPTVVVAEIDGYCDYAFLPRLAPGVAAHVIGDSDDAFLLELQDRDQESGYFQYGQITAEHVIENVREWATREHRDTVRNAIVFHSKDIPAETETVIQESREFIDQVEQAVGAPLDPCCHFYFVCGVRAWFSARGDHRSPPELNRNIPTYKLPALWKATLPPSSDNHRRWKGLARFLIGQVPRTKFAHPMAAAYRYILPCLRNVIDGARPGRVLIVADHGWIDREIEPSANILRLDPSIASFWQIAPEPPVDHVFIALSNGTEESIDIDKILRNVTPSARAGGTITVVFHHRYSASLDHWIGEQLRRGASFRSPLLVDVDWAIHYATDAEILYERHLWHAAQALASGGLSRKMFALMRITSALLRRFVNHGASPVNRQTPSVAIFTARVTEEPEAGEDKVTTAHRLPSLHAEATKR